MDELKSLTNDTKWVRPYFINNFVIGVYLGLHAIDKVSFGSFRFLMYMIPSATTQENQPRTCQFQSRYSLLSECTQILVIFPVVIQEV